MTSWQRNGTDMLDHRKFVLIVMSKSRELYFRPAMQASGDAPYGSPPPHSHHGLALKSPHIVEPRVLFCALANIYLTNDLLLSLQHESSICFHNFLIIIWSSWHLPCSLRLPRPKKYCTAFVYYQLHTPLASADHGCDHNWRRAVRHCYGALPQAQTWFQ